jgi:hypothetical protein
MRQRASLLALLACWLLQLGAGLVYYPKWNKPYTEATLSWDVSGYYLYLPALFIYKDIRRLEFKDDILRTYGPTPDFQQAFLHRGGNYVMKYSAGMALQYLPAFVTGHMVAKIGGYPADGFSKPYQMAINLWSLLVALAGVWFLRKVLLRYFSDVTTAVTLIAVVFATNYLDYSAIDTALTHNYLFTLYAILLWLTIRFYEFPSLRRALGIGAVVGLATLTRPTEIMCVIVPLLWGIKFPLWPELRERLRFLKTHLRILAGAAIVCIVIAGLQLAYWKVVAGEWIVYTYQEQEFSWLHPHLKDGLLSYNSGWLIYTPVMVFALMGIAFLLRRAPQAFLATLVFTVFFVYVCVAWDIWWYGASLGNRAMVQAYPVLALPMAAFFAWAIARPVMRYASLALLGLFIYYNLWLTHQAHKGGLYHAGHMTRAYFWKTVLDYRMNPSDLKLLDHPEEFTGERRNVRLLSFETFDSDTSYRMCGLPPIDGTGSACVGAEQQVTREYNAYPQGESDWIRASATFRCGLKEWDVWRMTQFSVRFYMDDQPVKDRHIRLQRLLSDNETREVFIDVRTPKKPFNEIAVWLWNAGSEKPLLMDNLRIEAFDE